MKILFVVMLWIVISSFALVSKASSSDDYLSGYIQSTFTHIFYLPADAVLVKDGIVYINEAKLGHYNPDQILQKVRQSTLGLPHIKDIKLVKDNSSEDLSTTKNKRIKKSIFTQKATSQVPVTDGLMGNHGLF